jgi:hypothetical protein
LNCPHLSESLRRDQSRVGIVKQSHQLRNGSILSKLSEPQGGCSPLRGIRQRVDQHRRVADEVRKLRPPKRLLDSISHVEMISREAESPRCAVRSV